MSIKKPTMPLSGGAEPLEPLDPRDLQNIVKSEKFEATLNQLEAQEEAEQTSGPQTPTRAALAQIANNSNLSPEAQVREAARYMVGARLQEKFRQSEQGETLLEDLSDYIADDPLLKKKLSSILQKLKSE